ncbi:hypothetical protein HZZ00_37755 (plasmid) [Streptomyces sp. NEAU-sy36]|uniref:hypothetical protein n=1 Tax=unclassified Streptomyces TaxID=2593676 RepID=UPI0015D5FFE4|nr:MULTISPECIES: hypothetical protein [unclassified Streptomyces]QLJ06777.1 hypothetical protein HZZ00_37755 [Streptomyces sp. NEAU-sy36]
MQPTTSSTYPDAWHAAEAAQETAWLNDWVRGRICPATLTARPDRTPADAVPALTSAGSY